MPGGKMPGAGRPRHYTSPEEFAGQVDLYVQTMRGELRPLTWTGLALFLGFTSRVALDEYKKYPEFKHEVMRAKLLVECGYEERLHSSAPGGAIFALKNAGWHDTSRIEGADGGDLFNSLSEALREMNHAVDHDIDMEGD